MPALCSAPCERYLIESCLRQTLLGSPSMEGDARDQRGEVTCPVAQLVGSRAGLEPRLSGSRPPTYCNRWGILPLGWLLQAARFLALLVSLPCPHSDRRDDAAEQAVSDQRRAEAVGCKAGKLGRRPPRSPRTPEQSVPGKGGEGRERARQRRERPGVPEDRPHSCPPCPLLASRVWTARVKGSAPPHTMSETPSLLFSITWQQKSGLCGASPGLRGEQWGTWKSPRGHGVRLLLLLLQDCGAGGTVRG